MNNPRPRIQPDGSLIFPNRCKPPSNIPGYEPEPGDPYLFRIVFCPCQYRTQITERRPCGKLYQKDFCNHFGLPITRQYCQQCQVPDK